ncbi:HNH endonuclease [Lentzea sp. NPDC058436]|uniref:HNH endonuclease n=1 Tax=Lentzea sp. NPDC058436 TaxID=3346499 RepID=UPI00364ACD04
MQAWSFLVAHDKRSFQGNDGYADVVEEYYLYDSGVPNHRHVREGDLVVLRTGKGALGVAVVEEVERTENVLKTRRRCPHCKKTRFNYRQNDVPHYMCGRDECGKGFDEPLVVQEPVTGFKAIYKGTWRAIGDVISVAEMERVTNNSARQNAIRPLDLAAVQELLNAAEVPDPPVSGATSNAPAKPIAAGKTKQLVTVRKGQDQFRKALFERYGLVCLITGPNPQEALHAAHLRAFAKHGRHVAEEGALLRADIHQLFDAGMIAVDPETLTVVVDPRLRVYRAYAALAGRPLQVPEDKTPLRDALSDHFVQATSMWIKTDVFWRPAGAPVVVDGLIRHP